MNEKVYRKILAQKIWEGSPYMTWREAEDEADRAISSWGDF